MKLKYWIKNKFDSLIRLPNEIKWFIQRGKAGYADCDFWNLDSYVDDIMIKGIEDIMYRGCHVGCLGGFSSTKKWPLNDPEAQEVHNLYRRMKRFFELNKLFESDHYMYDSKDLKRLHKASGLLLIRNWKRLWD